MSRRTGVWIDHEKAVVVTLYESRARIETVASGADRRVRLSGGARSRTPYGPQDIASDSQRQGKHQKQLTRFHRTLIEMFREAEALYVLGPGEAKLELRREIERVPPLRDKVAGIETRDKMTVRQISADVRAFFAGDRHRRKPAHSR